MASFNIAWIERVLFKKCKSAPSRAEQGVASKDVAKAVAHKTGHKGSIGMHGGVPVLVEGNGSAWDACCRPEIGLARKS